MNRCGVYQMGRDTVIPRLNSIFLKAVPTGSLNTQVFSIPCQYPISTRIKAQ